MNHLGVGFGAQAQKGLSMQRTETHHLPVKLHQHEVLVKAQQAAAGLSTLKRIEDDKAEVTKDFAEQIKKQRRALDLLAHEVSTGTEVRPVECDLVPRRADEMMDVIRPDTGEVVSSRPWTRSERDTFKQRALPFERDDESDNAH
jgi:hypothetical protein